MPNKNLPKSVTKPLSKPTARRKTKPPPITRNRDELFAEAYVLNGGNATKAAEAAGSAAENLAQAGLEFLRKPSVRELITRKRAELERQYEVNAKNIIGGLLGVARATVSDCLSDEGAFDLDKARETGTIHHIQKFEVKETPERVYDEEKGEYVTVLARTTKFSLYSKTEANKELAKIFGLQQAPRGNDFDTCVGAVKVYIQERKCSLDEAVAELSKVSAKFARHADRILEEGVV